MTIDYDEQTITLDHADALLGRRENSPWVVPAGAVERVELTPKSFGVKPSLRMFLRDRAGYQPGVGADMNVVTGSGGDEGTLRDLCTDIERLATEAAPVAHGPARRKPYNGPVSAPVGAVKFGDLILDGDTLYCNGEAIALRGAHAELMDADAARSRVTATRVAAGAIVAGPVGALIGGLAKKSTGRVYVMVTSDDGRVLSGDGASKESGKAAELVARINAASRGGQRP